MKKIKKALLLALSLMITATLFAGCGANNGDNSGSISGGTPIEKPSSGDSGEEPDVVTYTVNFVGVDNVASQTIDEGSTVVKPANPNKEYYTFDGWYNGDTVWDFEKDVVTKDLTLTAKFTAKTYTVKFVGFDKSETELTYTVETKDAFSFPEVPAAPEHYENARWNKTIEACVVFSEEIIVVEAVADVETHKVSFNTNGAEAMESVSVKYGEKLEANAPTMDGYLFKCWTLDGKAYDMSAPITDDITLVATWYAITNEGIDSLISADDILNGATFNTAQVSLLGSVDQTAGWYYDSDYNGNSGEGAVDSNVYKKIAQLNVIVAATEVEIELPAIDYKSYMKVDFVYEYSANYLEYFMINDVKVSQHGGQYKLVAIITDETGTRLELRDINTTGMPNSLQETIMLPESVANGTEGLRLKLKTVEGQGYELRITEFHAKSNRIDYLAEMEAALAKLPANVEELTGSEAESEAALKYMEAAKYLTSVENAAYPMPAVVKAALENIYVNAIVNAVPGSLEQMDAIEAYRAYTETLTDEEKESAAHKANVERINGLLQQKVNTQLQMSISGWETSGTKASNFVTAYKGTKQKTFDSGDYDGAAVLPAFNYNAYEEVYFGLYAVAGATQWEPTYIGENGVITVNGASFNGLDPRNGGYYFKVTVKDGVLTMVIEKANNVESGTVALTVALPQTVLNGTESLTFDFNFGAWSQAEITEMHLTEIVSLNKLTLIENHADVEISGTTAGQPNVYYPRNNWPSDGTHVVTQTETYDYLNFAQYNANSAAYTVTYTLAEVNFSQYSEVYFGVIAATAEGDCTINVGGASYSYDVSAAYLQMKIIVKGNTLTIIGDGANNEGQTLATVELSDAIINGNEALTLTWSTAGWSQVEITEMRAETEIKPLA